MYCTLCTIAFDEPRDQGITLVDAAVMCRVRCWQSMDQDSGQICCIDVGTVLNCLPGLHSIYLAAAPIMLMRMELQTCTRSCHLRTRIARCSFNSSNEHLLWSF